MPPASYILHPTTYFLQVRVGPDDRAKASQYTLQTVDRAVRLKQAFATWEKLHGQTVRAVSMTNHLQRRLFIILLLRVLDAWIRLTIQERGARLYKDRTAPRNPSSSAEAPQEGASAQGAAAAAQP